MDHSADPTEFREYWKRNYGPTIAVYRYIAADPGHVEELDRDFLNLLTEWNRSDAAGYTVYAAEYLLFTARRR
jgi:2-polyprenyl-6-hydroxyphenyl methylase/3-demethylubiquinone-9 3-methyltransferase